jgi:peptide alpha-N-acetyltransferase
LLFEAKRIFSKKDEIRKQLTLQTQQKATDKQNENGTRTNNSTSQSDKTKENTHNSEEVVPPEEIEYINYTSEEQLPGISALIDKDLSEPYSIYTYRYFVNNWPKLCFLVSRSTCSNMKNLICFAEGHGTGKVCGCSYIKSG